MHNKHDIDSEQYLVLEVLLCWIWERSQYKDLETAFKILLSFFSDRFARLNGKPYSSHRDYCQEIIIIEIPYLWEKHIVDKQNSKKNPNNPQPNHQTLQKKKKNPGNKITFLTAWLRLSIYLQEVSWLAPVPQFPFTNMEIIDITSYNVLRA